MFIFKKFKEIYIHLNEFVLFPFIVMSVSTKIQVVLDDNIYNNGQKLMIACWYKCDKYSIEAPNSVFFHNLKLCQFPLN